MFRERPIFNALYCYKRYTKGLPSNMDCKLCLIVLAAASCGITNAQDIEFPFCVWGIQWIYQPNFVLDPETAWVACKASCMPLMTTHFGMTRMVDEDDMVHCVCGEYTNLAHEPENCDLVCGDQNKYPCGGPIEDLTPSYMSVYSVCDPYDFHGQNCQIPCPETCYLGCDRNTAECIYGCDPGYYDLMCSTPCPANCVDGLCHDFGWCHECVDGYHGDFCDLCCNCSGGSCDQNTGECYCDHGWCGPSCNETCAVVNERCPISVAESEGEMKPECGQVIPAWTIALIVLMFFVGGATASMITYFACVKRDKGGQQSERKNATKRQSENEKTGTVKTKDGLYQDVAFDNKAYKADPSFAI